MASSPPATNMEQEAMCSICMEYLKQPVSVDCGHNFCQGCIIKYCEIWEEIEPSLACPLCKSPIKKESLRPNWQLANIIEELRSLPLITEKDNLCVKHKKECHLFCKQEREAVCVACERSPQHREHPVILLEDAAREYKVKIQANIQTLETQKENLVDLKLAEEQRSQKCLAQLGEEKLKVKSAFEQMEKFLEEKKSFWMAQLRHLEKEIEKRQEENVARLSEEISRLTNSIAELAEKCQQPAKEFMQDIRRTLNRCQKEGERQLLKFSPDLEERLRSYSFKHSILKGMMKKCEESLEGVLNTESLERPLNKVNVTLDPDTAYPFLALSEDLKSVRWKELCQDLPDNPERFDSRPWVLGCERFTSGRHWWEVEVEAWPMAKWVVGVARDSVRRKKITILDPEEGIWAMGKISYLPLQVLAFTSPKRTCLTLRSVPRKIQILLDYEKGHVDFFDAHTNDWIFTFHSVSFSREEIRPFLGGCGAIRLHC